MAQHTFSGAGAPATTPSARNQHYNDTSNGDIYISNGTASSANWINITASAGDINQLTGDVTAGPGNGSQAATLDKTALTGKSAVTPASGDSILISDVSDSGNLKKATVSDLLALSPASAPAGSNTQVQFNDSGAFGGDAGFTYDKTTDTATLGNLSLTNPLPLNSGGWGINMTPQTISSGTTFNALTPGLISFTSSGGNIAINGITAPSSASGGFTRIQNNTPVSTTVSLSNQSGSATAANRIIPDLVGQTYVLARGQAVDLFYDTSVSRWRVLRFGVSAVSAPLTLSTRGLLAMSTAGGGSSGYITNVDYSRWEQKLGDSDPLTTSIAHSIPYFLDVDLDVPKKVTSSNEFLYNNTLNMLGSGVPYADISAKVHAQSGTVLTVVDPDSTSNTVNQNQVDIPAAPASVSISQDYPDIARYTDNGTSAANIGAGSYAAADVVDYIVRAGYDDGSNPIVWSVATGTITGITDAATFDVGVAINNATSQNFTPNVWSFSRQVNGGGYNDYQRFTATTPTDANSGWTAGADPSGFTNLADDFLADGTDYTGIIQFYETGLSPDGLQTIVSAVYDPLFIDDNSGNAYKMYVSNAPLHPWYGVRVSWPATRKFEVAPYSSYVGYFFSGPIGVTTSGAPVTTPTSWGYLSNGTNLNNTFEYFSSATAGGSTYYSANSYQTVFTDPNDGNYYYYQIGSATDAGKMEKDGSLYKVFAVNDFIADGDASVYPDNSTVTPKSFAYTALRTDTKGTTTAEIVGIVHHALDASGRIIHSWTDDTNAEMASVKVDAAKYEITSPLVDLNGDVKLGVNGSPLTSVLAATATLNFPSTSSYEDLTVTVTGAAVGDVVSVGVPNDCMFSHTLYFGWVSATDTVTVRFLVVGAGPHNPPSSTFKVLVTKF